MKKKEILFRTNRRVKRGSILFVHLRWEHFLHEEESRCELVFNGKTSQWLKCLLFIVVTHTKLHRVLLLFKNEVIKIVTMIIFSKLNYRFNTMTIMIPYEFLVKIDKLILKHIWKCQGLRRSKTFLKKEEEWEEKEGKGEGEEEEKENHTCS